MAIYALLGRILGVPLLKLCLSIFNGRKPFSGTPRGRLRVGSGTGGPHKPQDLMLGVGGERRQGIDDAG